MKSFNILESIFVLIFSDSNLLLIREQLWYVGRRGLVTFQKIGYEEVSAIYVLDVCFFLMYLNIRSVS